MITNLHIKNFKGFSDLSIKDTSRVTLIGGCNNVGKTSLLEALLLFYGRDNPYTVSNLHAVRGIPSVEGTPSSLWAPLFLDYDLGSEIEILVDTEKQEREKLLVRFHNTIREQSIANNIVASDMKQPFRTDGESALFGVLEMTYRAGEDVEGKTAHIVLRQDSVKMYPDYQVASFPKTWLMISGARNHPEDAKLFGMMDIVGKQNEITEFIKRTIEPRLVSLSAITLGDKTILHAQLEGMRRKIPIAYLGDGTARLVSIILAISTTQDGCILMDEIENGIHHSVLPKIWRGIMAAAKQYNCQIFATTHSYECLAAAVNGLDGELAEDFRYIRLERDGEELFSTTYSHRDLAIAVEREWEVR